jgi:ATP-dependent helicase HrpA
VLCGETGSGKTTQLPKICLDLGRGVGAMIGHTQPRRIAARSVSTRLASELHTVVGQGVGFKIRFSDRVGEGTWIKVMTDGTLLAEIHSDPLLNAYDTIILDEAHERSLNIDFLLGYFKQLLPRRPDLKLVITSATIDPQGFARHFDGAPVIQVPGRVYPVEVRYRPPPERDRGDADLQSQVVEAVGELVENGPGDILVFLAGEREIRETADALGKNLAQPAELVPLYARLNTARQERIFAPHAGRRIVLATNVAETSLTVPNIRYVIDAGHARISRYSYRRKVQQLPVETISQASAEQRKGRCGRIGPGICVRLYARESFEERAEFTEPEIRRTNLAAVILQMKALDLGAMEDFPFPEPPDPRFVRDGYRLLRELGALDDTDRLTRLGGQLAKLPLDPRFGRMILAGAEHGCLAETLIIASALSVRDPRDRTLENREAATKAHQRFVDKQSDFMGFVNLWNDYHDPGLRLTGSQLRRLCRERFLSYPRMREWQEVHRQLVLTCSEMGLRRAKEKAAYKNVHQALLTGLLDHVGQRKDKGEYQAGGGGKFVISPGSALAGGGANWVVAAEIVETGRRYAHTVARVRPEWIEQAGRHLVRRSFFDPYWDDRSGQVLGYERVSLSGLTLIPRRGTRCERFAPTQAREIFIRCALVDGRGALEAPFLRHNESLAASIRDREHKLRRLCPSADEDAFEALYDARIPPDICNTRRFEQWRAGAERENPRCLFIDEHELLGPGGFDAPGTQFPDRLALHGHGIPLRYRFTPGSEEDGLTATLPAALLEQVDAGMFEWLVPGMVEEKILALLRSLPKHLRRNFVPLPDCAHRCAAGLRPDGRSLRRNLGEYLGRQGGVEIAAHDWHEDRLAPHLLMRFRIVDADGKVVGHGRDLGELKRRLGVGSAAPVRRLPRAGIERDGLTAWNFEPLPESVSFDVQGATFHGFPALVDRGGSVAVRIAASTDQARHWHRLGLRRLFMLELARPVARLRRQLPGIRELCLAYLSCTFADPFGVPDGEARRGAPGSAEELTGDLLGLVVDQAFGLCSGGPRSREEFQQRKREGTPRLVDLGNEICALAGEILGRCRTVGSRFRQLPAKIPADARQDIESQMRHLMHRGLFARIPLDNLRNLPRYLDALQRRLDRLVADPGRDARRTLEVAPYWKQYLDYLETRAPEGLPEPDVLAYRWMVEELRVSLFAQELGTPRPVSGKRLQAHWQARLRHREATGEM